MRHLFYILVTLLLTMTACAPAPKLLGNPEAPYPPDPAPSIGDILHLPTGVYVDQQVLFDNAARNRIVYVGETHDNPASHRLQLEILQAMIQANPNKVSLGMEMFNTFQQPILDQWTAGELDEKAFLREVDWYNNWQMDFGFYRDLLLFCRDQGVKLLALNVNKDLQKKVGRTPFDQLSSEEQARLPKLDMDDPYQRAMTEAVFSDHKMGKAMLEGFLRVQTLWDESMAQNIASYLAEQGTDRQLLVIAGGNHIRYGYGIPRRVFRRLPVSYLLVGSEELEIPEDKQDRLMDIEKPKFPMLPYEFVAFTAYEDLPQRGVTLGIMLEQTTAGLQIRGVLPGSVAEKAGLQQDDLLLKFGEIPLKDRLDLIYELKQLEVGVTIELTLQRGDEILTLPVLISEARPQHSRMPSK